MKFSPDKICIFQYKINIIFLCTSYFLQIDETYIDWIRTDLLWRITKYWAVVTLLAISIGLAIGWTSPYLAQLTGEDPPFRITQEEGSWIASLLPLGRLLGAVIGSLIVEYIGSKMSVLLTGLPMIFSWICIICATSPIWLYVARIFSGNSIRS